MEQYANLGRDSGVVAYEITADSITVQFRDHSLYLYNFNRPGTEAVEHMKSLALAGRGLNSYISRVVRKNFAQKIR